MFRKTLSFLLVLCMLAAQTLSAMAGEPVEIKVLTAWQVSDTNPEISETVVAQELQNVLNMKMTPVYTTSDSISTKVANMLSNGEFPDIAMTRVDGSNTFATVNKYGERGYFLAISDYLDKLPNLKAILDSHPEITKSITAVDGKIYALPLICDFADIMYTTALIRDDVLKECGLSAEGIITIDDLTNALGAMTEKMGTPAWIQREGYDEFMMYSGYLWNVANKVFWDYETGTYTHPARVARYKDYVAWLNKLYTEGIIHPDWTIMSDETWEGMLAANQGFFTIDRMSIIGDANFDESFDWQPMLYPQIDGKAFLQPQRTIVDPNNSWVINAKSSPEVIDKALELMNYVYSTENHDQILAVGVEGKTWTREDANTAAGIRWLVQIYGENSDVEGAELYSMHAPQEFTRLYREIDLLAFPGKYPYAAQAFTQKVLDTVGGFRPNEPYVSFTDDELQTISSLGTDMNTYFDENIVKFVEGKRSMDEWEAFTQEIEGLGLEQLLSVYNAGLARYNQQ